MRSIFIITFLLLGSLVSHAACKISDVEILQIRFYDDDGPVKRLTGTIRNNCKTEIGVEIYILIKNEDGSVYDVERVWASGTRNIAPGGEYPFSRPIVAEIKNRKITAIITLT